jgi:hypothetical protein
MQSDGQARYLRCRIPRGPHARQLRQQLSEPRHFFHHQPPSADPPLQPDFPPSRHPDFPPSRHPDFPTSRLPAIPPSRLPDFPDFPTSASVAGTHTPTQSTVSVAKSGGSLETNLCLRSTIKSISLVDVDLSLGRAGRLPGCPRGADVDAGAAAGIRGR